MLVDQLIPTSSTPQQIKERSIDTFQFLDPITVWTQLLINSLDSKLPYQTAACLIPTIMGRKFMNPHLTRVSLPEISDSWIRR